jgi:hypothetical protein
MIMAQLLCPTCGDGDQLLSVERIMRAYPVTAEENPAAPGRAALTFTGAPVETWDENPEPTGMIKCNTCGSSFGRGSLVTTPPA